MKNRIVLRACRAQSPARGLLSLSLGSLLSVSATAQAVGTFGPGFNHNEGTTKAINASHMAALPTPEFTTPSQIIANTRVLIWGVKEGGSVTGDITSWAVVRPHMDPGMPVVSTNRFPNGIVDEAMGMGNGNLFCGGQTWLSSGNLICFGGTSGTLGNPIGTDIVFEYFLPDASFLWGRFQSRPRLAVKRWYAGACRLSIDKAGAFGGIIGNEMSANTYEMYWESVVGFESHPPGIPGQCVSPGGDPLKVNQEYCGPGLNPFREEAHLGQYARLHQLAGHVKQVFSAGPNAEAPNAAVGVVGKYLPSRVEHDPMVAIPTWDLMLSNNPPPAPPTNTPREYGCSVRMPVPVFSDDLDKVVNFGGENWQLPAGQRVTNTTEICFPSRTGPGSSGWDYSPGTPMHKERRDANAMVLPTGEILLVGGQGNNDAMGNPVHQTAPELLRGTTWVLGTAAPEPSPRSYHSTGVLLPSGALLLGGGNSRNFDYEILSPWYMTGYYRPVIQTYPSIVAYGATQLEVTYDLLPGGLHSVTKVVLMRPGTCTHHFDMGQRYVECQVTSSSRTKVKFNAPLNRELAPQGYYMLWLLTAENVPSVAVWVTVRP